MQHQAQIDRIKTKLAAFQLTQKRWQPPQPVPLAQLEKWESNSLQSLPEAFRLFLLQIGVPAPCAFSGIEAEFSSRTVDRSVCGLTPGSADPVVWKRLWESEETADRLFDGLFEFESQGCSFSTAIALNGPYRGCIVYIDREGAPPFWCHEQNFLEWYERWLDEVELGYRHNGDCQFGLGPAGGEDELFSWINDLQRSLSQRCEALHALCKLPTLNNIDRLTELVHCSELELRTTSCAVIGHRRITELFDSIVDAIGDPSPTLRTSAAMAIRRFLEDEKCVELAIPLLERAVLFDADSGVAATAASALVRTENVSRNFGLEALNRCPHAAVINVLSCRFPWHIDDEKLLVRLLNCSSRETQNWAALGLLKLPPVAMRATLDKLTNCLVSGQCDHSAEHLLKHLKRFDSPEVADALLQWTSSPNDYCRIEAVTALIERGDARVLNSALKMLDESRPPRYQGRSSTQLMSQSVYLAALESPNRKLARQLVANESEPWRP